MQQTEIEILLEKFVKGQLSKVEELTLQQWYQSVEHGEVMIPVDSEDEKARIFRRLQNVLENHRHPGKVVSLQRNKKNWYKWVAAACILVIMAGGGLYFLRENLPDKKPVNIAQKPGTANAESIVPGSNKATLILSDGSAIVLDNEKPDTIATEGSTLIIKQDDGSIVYGAANKTPEKIQYNTVNVPRGGQYQITLPDGTKVWLNAASSLTFPTAFAGHERKIQLVGEAYFEVARKTNQPFIVEANQTKVQVLGTHFNVMAYTDEKHIETTLLEGAVKVLEGSDSVILRPGQQSVCSRSGGTLLVRLANVSAVIAWKEGYYFFNKTDVQTIMRQIERWYDVEVEYQGVVPTDLIVGKIPRSADLKEVLHIMELIGLRFKISGHKVIVLS